MIGTTIGRYRILAKLGEGGMGTVWKAQHTLLPDHIVALKLLSESLWESEEARQRFLREAIAVSKLDHPRIATLYDAEHVEGRLCIAFKFIDGETVARKTEAGPLPLGEAVAIAADAAAALAHAHARGVVHRDVSAGNIIVDREGHGVVVDFGLARSGVETQLTRTGTTLGTLAYMAPEVLRGGAADARSDLYGLGAVLHRMVTGRPLFVADSAEALQYKVLNEVPRVPSELRPGVPPALDDLILRLVEKQPGDRYASAEVLLEELERVGKLPAIAAERTAPIAVPWWARWPRRWQRVARRRSARWVLAVGGVLLLAAAGTGIAWVRGWRPGFMTPRIPVLAVLPPRNTSQDLEETAYLAEGLGEELASRLGEVSELRIIPWITTQRFGDASQPINIARELRADALVVGSYRSDGDRIRLTVTVVDGHSGLQRWSKTYEESVQDLLVLQRNVSLGLASQFKPALTSEERQRLGVAPSNNPEAYDHFIRGASYLHAYDPQSIASAELFFKKATQLDPGLAEAWVGLGAIYTDRYFRGDGGFAELNEGERCFRTALEHDPKLAAAERGLVRVYYERGEAEAALKVGAAAARRGPDDIEALLVRGWAYTLGGLPEKAVPVFNHILELDPANQGAAWYRVVAEAWAEQPALAIEHARAYLRRFPEDGEIYTWLGVCLVAQGKSADARLCYERALELFGNELSNVYVVLFAVNLYGQLGEQGRMHALAERWAAILETKLAAFPDNLRVRGWLAGFYAALGRRAEVERTVDQYLAQAAGTGEFAGGAMFTLPDFLMRVGSVDRAESVCRTLAKGDLGMASFLARAWWIENAAGARADVLQADPEYRALHNAIRQRIVELSARY